MGNKITADVLATYVTSEVLRRHKENFGLVYVHECAPTHMSPGLLENDGFVPK